MQYLGKDDGWQPGQADYRIIRIGLKANEARQFVRDNFGPQDGRGRGGLGSLRAARMNRAQLALLEAAGVLVER
jgi:hypothetical protein